MARPTRRELVRVGVILAAAGLVMARPWQGLLPPDLGFEAVSELPPLRRLVQTGDVSGGSATQAVLIGLEPPDALRGRSTGVTDGLRRDLCGALALSWPAGGPVPVTYFTDINCPVCRRLDAHVASLRSDGVPFRLITRPFASIR